eukprot:gene11937-15211_t
MLAIGRALMTNPYLLILDEATEGLAPLIREEIWSCLKSLREYGLTIIIIDKYIKRLIGFADRHTILEKGKVVWQGDSTQLAAQPEDCEAGYNLKAAFPDFPQVLQVWQNATAAIRPTLLSDADIAYGSAPLQGFDFYRADGSQRPLLIFIHGGYWRSLDKSDHSFIAPPFTQAGFCVVVVNYALCPGTPDAPVTIPHIARQMEKALGWVWHQIAFPHIARQMEKALGW